MSIRAAAMRAACRLGATTSPPEHTLLTALAYLLAASLTVCLDKKNKLIDQLNRRLRILVSPRLGSEDAGRPPPAAGEAEGTTQGGTAAMEE